MTTKITYFIGWFFIFSQLSWAENPNFNLTQTTPLQGDLYLPLLDIAGKTAFKNVNIHFDFATNTFQLNGAEALPEVTEKQTGVMLGAYIDAYAGEPAVIKSHLQNFDAWAGTRLSLVGLFLDVEEAEPEYNVITPLTELSKQGYSAFINLNSHSRSMAEMAQGAVDASLTQIAQSFATWFQQQPDNKVFIAPFPEMNGSWESYGQDIDNFKLAYQRIQNIFSQAGIQRHNIYWVFAPNGWSEEGHEFERYYPSDDSVDIVAFSAYNWGFCTNAAYKAWEDEQQVFADYAQRMRANYPDKPLFISQTATASATEQGNNPLQKDQWLQDSYRYLAGINGLRAILYFNLDKECDWSIYRLTGDNALGYQTVVSQPPFAYIKNQDIAF